MACFVRCAGWRYDPTMTPLAIIESHVDEIRALRARGAMRPPTVELLRDILHEAEFLATESRRTKREAFLSNEGGAAWRSMSW